MKILYFAWLRTRLGHDEETLEKPDDVETVADLRAFLRQRGGAYAVVFEETQQIKCAINQEFAQPEARLSAGDEVAFFPPVTGG